VNLNSEKTVCICLQTVWKIDQYQSVPAFSCAWRPCRSSDTHNPLKMYAT